MRTFINRPGYMVAGTQSPNKVRGLRKNHSSRGGEEIAPGTLHGGEEIAPGTLHGGEEIAPGTLHSCNLLQGGALCASFTPGVYRTQDGTAIYKFRYVPDGYGFEIDILEQPSYSAKDSSSVVSHRISSPRGGWQICISPAYKPRTIEKARAISAEWAELTHQYIITGVSIDVQVKKRAKANKQAQKSTIGGFLNWLFN